MNGVMAKAGCILAVSACAPAAAGVYFRSGLKNGVDSRIQGVRLALLFERLQVLLISEKMFFKIIDA